MIEALLVLIALIALITLVVTLRMSKTKNDTDSAAVRESVQRLEILLNQLELRLKDEFERNRRENNEQAATSRTELSKSLETFGTRFGENTQQLNELLRQKFADFTQRLDEQNKQSSERLQEIRLQVEKNLNHLREDNTKQLDEMRKTVDEKLQKTLNDRLSQSFETVGKQLQAVQEGLGEMKNLANDVGGLKRVLSNVKTRGGIGEIQLEMLLEQILAPDQYQANVQTKQGSSEVVEFAIKLPGRDDNGQHVWLPVDAKFPKDVYEKLLDAYETGEVAEIEAARKGLESTIKKMAKDISEKYVDPPYTTDFAILFLPFEGIYAEVVRKAALLEDLQRNHKIIVTGPTTLAAILNSLQMGFKTLAIQQRSSEVWQILGAVKTEFDKFGGLMDKAQKNIQTGLNQLDEVMGTRTRAIQRRLRGVEALSDGESRELLPGIGTDIDDGDPD